MQHMRPQIRPDDTPRARRTDPVESHAAADSTDVHGSQQHVLELFVHYGALADHQLVRLAEEDQRAEVRRYTPSRLRTARKELLNAGLVQDTGRKTVTPTGRAASVWAITMRGLEAAA